jgi:hypothetical protein
MTEDILADITVPGNNVTGAHLFGDKGGKWQDGFEKPPNRRQT